MKQSWAGNNREPWPNPRENSCCREGGPFDRRSGLPRETAIVRPSRELARINKMIPLCSCQSLLGPPNGQTKLVSVRLESHWQQSLQISLSWGHSTRGERIWSRGTNGGSPANRRYSRANVKEWLFPELYSEAIRITILNPIIYAKAIPPKGNVFRGHLKFSFTTTAWIYAIKKKNHTIHSIAETQKRWMSEMV